MSLRNFKLSDRDQEFCYRINSLAVELETFWKEEFFVMAASEFIVILTVLTDLDVLNLTAFV